MLKSVLMCMCMLHMSLIMQCVHYSLILSQCSAAVAVCEQGWGVVCHVLRMERGVRVVVSMATEPHPLPAI